ncbi:glycoside hydrolase family 15 protein [Legionella sp.]|uniref:glycoside hydrolase family 15 protein n=1 Tax=Legionella sp. TaxID=459 RepID=UPI003CA2EBD2
MKRIFFLTLFFVSQTIAAVFSSEEVEKLKHNFFANIQSNGAIIASPSKEEPNYYFDWIRDSAIAMCLIETWYESTHSQKLKDQLVHYVSWTQLIQHQNESLPRQDIMGEPKFYINGYPFEDSWVRPQNDGPALRATVLIHFAHQLLNQNEVEYVHNFLYNSSLDSSSMGVIKMDLEYTAHHWVDENFDLWEEVFGHHFFTTMAQQKALLEGATLARRLNDKSAAVYYEKQADLMNTRLYQHLDQNNYLIQATLPPHLGPQKTFELDSSVILAILLNPQSGILAPSSIYVEKTVNALHDQFKQIFPINNNISGPILFGRYPGDTYDGYQTSSIGNPWFTLTATLAEYYFTLAENLPIDEQSLMLQYIHIGDAYLKLIKHYAPEMNLSEQINLNTGIQQGASSLTWSYVSVLRALEVREKLAQMKK